MLKLNRTNESGRSMVEMLGVLAIIGVLCVGGITGYTTAMRAHHANEIVNATSMSYMMGVAANEGTGGNRLEYSPVPNGVSTITFLATNQIEITGITDVPLCNQVKSKLGNKVTGDCTGNASTLTVTLGAAELAGEETTIFCDNYLDEDCMETGRSACEALGKTWASGPGGYGCCDSGSFLLWDHTCCALSDMIGSTNGPYYCFKGANTNCYPGDKDCACRVASHKPVTGPGGGACCDDDGNNYYYTDDGKCCPSNAMSYDGNSYICTDENAKSPYSSWNT